MNRSREFAETLLQRARDDARMLRQLAADPEIPDWGVGFHAQQAAEKAIKAVLAACGVDYPRTHNVQLLLRLVGEAGRSAPPDALELPRLTPYGTVLRYDEPGPEDATTPLDRAWALHAVERTIRWAGTSLGETQQPQG